MSMDELLHGGASTLLNLMSSGPTGPQCPAAAQDSHRDADALSALWRRHLHVWRLAKGKEQPICPPAL